ncbi:GH12 family glycosyl hydrolase domain-containing protein [Actinoplanes sp. NPDC049118]|uniref:GH12 family glycosyl hydrolase domain-containing protein n=1 Tax=Actinoplanes sp. NPDC049118 TaxID=3155769 RepID=UPI003404CCCB
MRRQRIRLLPLVLSLALAGGAAAAWSTTANAATGPICSRFGSTVQGDYYVQNNVWGSTATQCINVTGNGFQITRQDGVNASGPVSYPSIFLGCHYTLCSPGLRTPRRISGIGSARSSISYTFANAKYAAAYDIWLDPTPRTNGVNQQEIMIWFNRSATPQPIGSVTGTASVGGRSWQVWTGSNGSNNVISYVSASAISSWSFDVKAFLNDSIARGHGSSSWYLTSIQAGFEPWAGGIGLTVNSFSASVT